MINLSDEQLNALERLKSFVDSNEDVIVLQGFAGTGKTYILKYYIAFLESRNIDYTLCAPTHKAKIVLQNATNREAITVHKLCQIAPKLDILRLDFADLQFHSKGVGEFPYKGIVIVDEASMISDSLYDLLYQYSKETGNKLCFICDSAQLQPVNNGGLSKVFQNTNRITLTEIFRQTETNTLSNLLFDLRDKVIRDYKSSDDGSIIVYNDVKSFVKNALEGIKQSIELKDLNHSKLIVYTNKRLSEYNKLFRKCLYKDDDIFHKGEILIGCENFSNGNCEFYNSADYIIIQLKETTSYIPQYGNTPGFILTLYDGEKLQDVFIINPNKNDLEHLAYIVENTRLDAMNATGKQRGKNWKLYYDIMKSFATPSNLIFDGRVVKPKTFDYGYAITSHRAQGSSYNKVFVDMRNLLLDKDELELRQLQYVSLSRTRTNVNIYI